MTNEPIAWMVYTLDGKSVCVTDNPTDFTPEHRALPLYTSPPAQRTWVGLTDGEYSSLHDGLYQQGKSLGWVVDQIEDKLREKNT